MKITLTGSLGHIGKPLTKELVQKGHTVTVVSSNPEKQKDIEALGAIAAIGSLEDVRFLTAAFTGADAVYSMIPPPTHFDQGFDTFDFCRKLSNNFAQAVQQSGVKRLVHLSSIGAHLAKGTGLIVAHHDVEKTLNKLSDVAITHIRPVAFYYNLYGFVNAIKGAGVIASNYGAEDRIAWVSPMDIAAAIAEEITEEITTPVAGRKIRYVASDEPTCNEIASTLGAAIGKPDLKWIVIGDEELQSRLEAAGVPTQLATGLAEMNASMHRNELFQDYFLNRPKVMGQVKIAEFAKEFAVVFNQK